MQLKNKKKKVGKIFHPPQFCRDLKIQPVSTLGPDYPAATSPHPFIKLLPEGFRARADNWY